MVCDTTKDGVTHCNDRIRGLIENSCKVMNTAYRERPDMVNSYSSIVKRENNDEPEYSIEFLENESKFAAQNSE